MNIDLRNVSPQFEKNVNQLKTKQNIKTNVSAVEIMVNEYHTNKNKNDELVNEVAKLKRELSNIKYEYSEFKQAWKLLSSLSKEKKEK